MFNVLIFNNFQEKTLSIVKQQFPQVNEIKCICPVSTGIRHNS